MEQGYLSFLIQFQSTSLFQSMLLSLPDKVAGNVNFGCGTIGTEQRGSKVVVISCSRDFLNETLDLEGNSHS